MPCIGYVCVTQRKDLEEELLSALLGASWWNERQCPAGVSWWNERQCPVVAWRDRVHGGSGGWAYGLQAPESRRVLQQCSMDYCWWSLTPISNRQLQYKTVKINTKLSHRAWELTISISFGVWPFAGGHSRNILKIHSKCAKKQSITPYCAKQKSLREKAHYRAKLGSSHVEKKSPNPNQTISKERETSQAQPIHP